MSVRWTQDLEQEQLELLRLVREAEGKTTWEMFRSRSLVFTVRKARDLGWADKKVQVRREQIGTDMVEYVIEPFEKDCGCSGLLKYDDFFLRPDSVDSEG